MVMVVLERDCNGVLRWVYLSFYKKLTKIFNGVRVLGANGDKNETIRGRLRF